MVLNKINRENIDYMLNDGNKDFRQKNMSGLDLSSLDLSGAVLSGSNLKGVNLSGAVLSGSNLKYVNLTGANLTGAIIRGTNFTRAILIDALLDSVTRNNRTIFNETQFQENVITNNSNENTIKLSKNIYQGINNKNEGCTTYKKLFELINELDLSTKPKFYFNSQRGLDYGGLTRDVFDKYLSEFLRIFFINTKDDYVIMKKIDKEELLIRSTEQLKKLAIYAETRILIPIEDKLLKILKNPQNEFSNLNQKLNEIFKNKNKNKRKPENLKSLYFNEEIKFGNLLFQNNRNNKIINWSNDFTNEQKKDILLRFYLQDSGFKSYQQFLEMHQWINTYWDENYFVNKNSYSLNAFSQRIKIINERTGQTMNFNSNSNIKKELIDTNHNLKVLVEYIKKSDDNRKKFNKWATGSYLSNNIIFFVVTGIENENKKPFTAHTCGYTINIYDTPSPPRINTVNALITANTISSNYGML